jgi:hypothetical protein
MLSQGPISTVYRVLMFVRDRGCSEVLCAFKEVFARCSMLCIVCVVVPERPSDFPLLLLCPVSERLSAHP